MKKILSVLLVCIMLFSSVSIIACADTVQYYRDGLFEFYLEDGGAHIVNVLSSASQTTELTIPLRLCYDADKKISAPTLSSIVDDDNDAPDPFGSDYAYVTAVEEGALDSYISTLTTLSISRYVEDFDYNEVREYRKKLVSAMIEENGIPLKPGAKEILSWLKENGITTAMATANDLKRTTGYLEKIGISGYFDRIICADMVKLGKPAPDIYAFAASALGLSPDRTFAVEDSPNGVKSAYAAGCKVIMVPDLTEPDEELKKLLYAKVGSLLEIKNLL